MRSMKTIAMACGLALALTARTSHAQGVPAMGGPPPMGPMSVGPGFGGGLGMGPEPGLQFGMVLRGLGLTPEQHARARAIMDSHRSALQSLFAKLQATNEAMASRLLSTGRLQSSDFEPDVKAVTGLREQLMREGLDVALELRQMLTPEQLAKASAVSQRLKELQAEMRGLLGDPAAMPPPVD